MQFRDVLKKNHQHVNEHFQEQLKKVLDYVRQPSVSTDRTGIKETAEMTEGFP